MLAMGGGEGDMIYDGGGDEYSQKDMTESLRRQRLPRRLRKNVWWHFLLDCAPITVCLRFFRIRGSSGGGGGSTILALATLLPSDQINTGIALRAQ